MEKYINLFQNGEKLSTKEIAGEEWPDLHPKLQSQYTSQFMRQCRKWFVRWGQSFGHVDGHYQLLDTSNIMQNVDSRKKQLQSWTKHVQDEIFVGLEQFGNDARLSRALEKAMLDIQQTFITGKRRQLTLLEHGDHNDEPLTLDTRQESTENPEESREDKRTSRKLEV